MLILTLLNTYFSTWSLNEQSAGHFSHRPLYLDLNYLQSLSTELATDARGISLLHISHITMAWKEHFDEWAIKYVDQNYLGINIQWTYLLKKLESSCGFHYCGLLTNSPRELPKLNYKNQYNLRTIIICRLLSLRRNYCWVAWLEEDWATHPTSHKLEFIANRSVWITTNKVPTLLFIESALSWNVVVIVG